MQQKLVALKEAVTDLAVSGRYLYLSTGRNVSRLSLTGEGSPVTLVRGINITGIALQGSHLYWAALGLCACTAAHGQIGRVDLSGRNPRVLVKRLPFPTAIKSDGRYLYWGDLDTGWIGRARLDGSNVKQRFVRTLGGPVGLSVVGGVLYWANDIRADGVAE